MGGLDAPPRGLLWVWSVKVATARSHAEAGLTLSSEDPPVPEQGQWGVGWSGALVGRVVSEPSLRAVVSDELGGCCLLCRNTSDSPSTFPGFLGKSWTWGLLALPMTWDLGWGETGGGGAEAEPR